MHPTGTVTSIAVTAMTPDLVFRDLNMGEILTGPWTLDTAEAAETPQHLIGRR